MTEEKEQNREAGGLKERSRLSIAAYACVVIVLCGAGLYLFTHYTSQSPSVQAEEHSPPNLITQAKPLVESAQTTYDRALTLTQTSQASQALWLFCSVARFAEDRDLRAKAVLSGANLLQMSMKDSDLARSFFMFFLASFPNAEGTDAARLHLAVIDLERNKRGEAEVLLTSMLRDTPESPLAPTASYLAVETAKVSSAYEASWNQKMGRTVATIFPSRPWPLLVLLLSLVVAVGDIYISHKEKLRRGTPTTVVEVLLVLILTAYTTIVNQQRDALATQRLINASSQVERQ